MRSEALAGRHREGAHDVHVLDESALYFAPPLSPPSARHGRGRDKSGTLSGGQVSYALFQQLLGQLTIEYPLAIAAPDPAKRRKRARSRRRRRLPFQTNGVGFLFHPSTVCSNHSMICWAFVGC